MSAQAEAPLLTPAEVGRIFGVGVPQVTRWTNDGKLTPVRTPGGTRRYLLAEIEAWIKGEPLTRAEIDALLQQHVDALLKQHLDGTL